MGMVCMALLKGLQILKQKKENDESLSPVLRKGNLSTSTFRDDRRPYFDPHLKSICFSDSSISFENSDKFNDLTFPF